jgi:hypothetical protein
MQEFISYCDNKLNIIGSDSFPKSKTIYTVLPCLPPPPPANETAEKPPTKNLAEKIPGARQAAGKWLHPPTPLSLSD